MATSRRPHAQARLAALGAALAGCQLEGPSHPAEEGPPVFEWVEQAEYDCAERVDTGYVDGNPFDITVVSVDGHPVERETANAYVVMQEAAAADGVGIRIVSGFRTMAEQEELYACYTNCNCNNCNLAARPGYSNHQSGHALDLNTSAGGVLNWLNRRGGDFGFSRTVPSEDWHWEWWGGGPGGGPCLGLPCPQVPAEGGLVDDGGPCFQPHGPAQYWRRVQGEGEQGGLHWTNAFTSEPPDNWARWQLDLAGAGDYTVEVLTGGPYGLWSQTRYAVGHAGQTETRTLDQSAVTGWQSLGVFHFDAGGGQFVDVFDDFAGDVPADQHILADAVRLTPYVAPEPPKPDAAHVTPPFDAGASGPEDSDAVAPEIEADASAAPGEAPDGGEGGAGGWAGGSGGPDAGGTWPSAGGDDGAGGGLSAATAAHRSPRSLSYQGGCQAAPASSGASGAAGAALGLLVAARRRRRRRVASNRPDPARTAREGATARPADARSPKPGR